MKLHAARYTAGTEFCLATGDIRATQQLLGHEDIGTTANINVQPNEASLERKLAEIYESGDADNDSARPAGSQSFRSAKLRLAARMEAAGIEPACRSVGERQGDA